jgi:DNA-binding MarR family transcriptional regulator
VRDGRRIVCSITGKGRALYHRVLPRAQQAQADILALLEPQERAALHATLLKLRERIAARQQR